MMARGWVAGTLAAVAMLAVARPVLADDLDWVLDETKADDVKLDLAVPESPAFTVLGLTPESVVRPSSPRDLATSLLNGVDENGNLQSGIAIDTAPFMLAYGSDLTLREYADEHSWGIPNWMLGETQFSIATAKGTTDDDEAIRLSLGLRITLWDRGDPRRDAALLADLAGDHAAIHDNLRRLSSADLDALAKALELDDADEVVMALRKMTLAERHARLAREPELLAKLSWIDAGPIQKAQEHLEDARKRNWNASSWVIGGAPSWISDDGDVQDLTSQGGVVWSSLALDFDDIPGLRNLLSDYAKDHSQGIFHVRYRGDQRVPDAHDEGHFLDQDDLLVGARLRLGYPIFAASLEGAFVHADREGQDDDWSRFAVVVDLRLAKDLWLDVSFGGQSGRRGDEDPGFVLSSIKYGFSSETPEILH